MRFKKFFKKAAGKILLAASSIALALPAVAAESSTVDMSGVTQGVVNLVMALMPVIIVIVIVKALLESFMRMT